MKDNKKKSGWFSRLFKGGSKSLAEDNPNLTNPNLAVEEIVSPMKQIVRGFFERKLAVGALCVLICMFIVVFIGPLFMPRYYDSYTETTQQNISPGLGMMSVPSELKDDIKTIDGYGSFTVGLSNAGKVYVWGDTYDPVTGIDMEEIPEAVQNSKIVEVAAGIDHIVAVSEDGHVYAWGANKRGQYGYFDEDTAKGMDIVSEPEGLAKGTETIDAAHIAKITCGYQITAILMDDGQLYLWGNRKSYANMDSFVGKADLVDIDFTLNNIVGLTEARNSVFTGKRGLYDKYKTTLTGNAVAAKTFLKGRKIKQIVATTKNICGELDDGSLFFVGDAIGALDPVPALHAGEGFVSIAAGTYHYAGITSEGRVLAWGGNTLTQTSVPENTKGTTKLFCGSFQTYGVNDNHQLVTKWGNKGYLFGTDKYGADIFQRIIQGGKMTMTIGAVAVIISVIIGIIVGCISGYFGGKVDLILMRVTEIFAAIPFLPFALILSALMAQMNISENEKIFLLMVILGVLTWTGMARMVRAQVLVARENEYVTAAKAMGVRETVIAFKHILPNIVSIIFVSLTLDFATCLLTESSLSYLGFGVTYPRPTWGNMLNGVNNATIIKNFWWQWVFTSIFLAITCICINIVGDALRDVMDPKSDRDK